MPTNHTPENHAVLKHDLRRILLVRHALQTAGLCGPDDDPGNNGREAAQAVIDTLALHGGVVYLAPEPEPEEPFIIPPTLGERIKGGAISLTSRAAAASSRVPWGRLRALAPSRSKP